jgi:excisionase family DNA binding protein
MLRFLTVTEVALIFRVKVPTVYTWVKAGKLEHIKVGRLIRITEENLAAFLGSSAMYGTARRTPDSGEPVYKP